MSDDKLAEIKKAYEMYHFIGAVDSEWLLTTCAEQAKEHESLEHDLRQVWELHRAKDDEIATLKAENERLKAEVAQTKNIAEDWLDEYESTKTKLAALMAENERLKAGGCPNCQHALVVAAELKAASAKVRLQSAEAELAALKASEVTADELREQIDQAQAETRAVKCQLAAAEQRAADERVKGMEAIKTALEKRSVELDEYIADISAEIARLKAGKGEG